MRKTFKFFIMLLAMLLVVTGCGKKNEESSKKEDSSLEAVMKNMEDVKSFSMDVKFDFNISADGSTLAMNMGINGDVYQVDDKNVTVHMFTTMSMFGVKESVESYIQSKAGKVYTYTKGENEWTYTEEDDIADSWIKNFEKYNFKNIKEETSDKDGYTKYTATISKEDINKVMGMLDETLGESIEKIEFKEDIKYTIYVKDGYVSIMEVDMTEIFKSLMPIEDVNLGNYDMTVKMTLEFSNFNKVDEIVIPDDVVKNAKLEKELAIE